MSRSFNERTAPMEIGTIILKDFNDDQDAAAFNTEESEQAEQIGLFIHGQLFGSQTQQLKLCQDADLQQLDENLNALRCNQADGLIVVKFKQHLKSYINDMKGNLHALRDCAERIEIDGWAIVGVCKQPAAVSAPAAAPEEASRHAATEGGLFAALKEGGGGTGAGPKKGFLGSKGLGFSNR